MKHNKDVELSNVEEVNDGADLISGHLRSEYKTLQAKLIEEEFDSICLDHIIAHNDGFTCQNSQLYE